MSDNIVPHLSEAGWVDSPTEKIDILFSHMLVSDESQTAMYPGIVTSIPAIMQKYNNDMPGLRTGLESGIKAYFSRYFNQVDLEVKITDDPADASKQEIRIYCKLTDSNNNTYNLTEALQNKDGILSRVTAML